jgi:uncharacterized protein YraI
MRPNGNFVNVGVGALVLLFGFTLVKAGAELGPGPATVKADYLNVRARPTLQSEVIGQLRQGDLVHVVEIVKTEKQAAGEPATWAKIKLPTNCFVWVHSDYIDPETKTVRATKLNVRSGPGENYPVLGRLERGAPVVPIIAKDKWIQIEPPEVAVAYVAAQYLEPVADGVPVQPQVPPQVPPSIPPTAGEPGTTGVEAQVPVPPPISQPAVLEPTPVTPALPMEQSTGQVTQALVLESKPQPAVQPEPEQPQKRIVQREGVIRPSVSIQAPTTYSLVNPKTGETINFLYVPTTNLDLAKYKGLRVIVTGEEGIHRRWPNTPVLTIQKIQVVE